MNQFINYLTHRDDQHVRIMVRFQLSDDVNHFYVTYTVDLLSVTENILFYTWFYPKKGPKWFLMVVNNEFHMSPTEYSTDLGNKRLTTKTLWGSLDELSWICMLTSVTWLERSIPLSSHRISDTHTHTHTHTHTVLHRGVTPVSRKIKMWHQRRI